MRGEWKLDFIVLIDVYSLKASFLSLSDGSRRDEYTNNSFPEV